MWMWDKVLEMPDKFEYSNIVVNAYEHAICNIKEDDEDSFPALMQKIHAIRTDPGFHRQKTSPVDNKNLFIWYKRYANQDCSQRD
jgi:hypothetical protein